MSATTSPAHQLFRPDHRAADALRTVRMTPHYVAMAEGSILMESGHTRVLCNATVEQGVPGWLRNSGRGWVTAEYGMLPRATLTRTARESERGKVERTIILDCDVLQADGGTRTAAITGACVALALALGKLVKAGTLKASPLKQMVAATSVGIVDGNVLLDLCYEEDSRAAVDMNVVMLASGGLVETQATAERDAYTRTQLGQMLDFAEKGIHELLAAQQATLEAAQ
jgi:ribonuclease PH